MLLLMMWQLDPRRVNDPADPVAAAPGSFLLFRRQAYAAIGGHAAVRDKVVEDLGLAEQVKRGGRRLRLLAAPHLFATSRAQSLAVLWTSWLRVTVDGLGRRPALAFVGALAVQLFFLTPYLLAPLGWPFLALASVHLLVTRAVRAQLGFAYGVDQRLAWLQPLGALLAELILLRALLALIGVGAAVAWRGRKYSA
jgi:hypothetical protein